MGVLCPRYLFFALWRAPKIIRRLTCVSYSASGTRDLRCCCPSTNPPGVAIAHKVIADFPHAPARLIIAGPALLPNAKVWSLRAMMPHAQFENIVMTDSDIGLEANCLETVISELSQPGVALITCPYRAAGGPGSGRALNLSA